MHARLPTLAGLPATPSEYSERKESVVALVVQTLPCACGGSCSPAHAEDARHSSAVRAFRTGSSVGSVTDLSAVPVAPARRVACDAEARREPSRRLSSIFGKAKIGHCKCSTGGATRQWVLMRQGCIRTLGVCFDMLIPGTRSRVPTHNCLFPDVSIFASFVL